MSSQLPIRLADRIRTAAALLDGSMIDDATWRVRHRWISLFGWVMTLGCIAVAPIYSGEGRWAYAAVTVGGMVLSTIEGLGRRGREMAVVVALAAVQLFVTKYVGSLPLGPVEIVILTFYQDWVPIVLGCVFVLAAVAVTLFAPALYASARGFGAEDPAVAMTFRAVTVISAAVVATFIWRLGTQRSRDPLTGMISRAGAERLLERHLRRGRRPVVWVFDIDRFSLVNSQLGMDVGDRLLLHLATAVQQLCKSASATHVAARLGADTFMIACEDPPEDGGVAILAHRISDELGVPWSWPGGDDIPVRVSVGAAVAVDGEDAAALVRVAEQNMREAKKLGQVRVVVDRVTKPRSTGSSALLTAELYRACERRELELHLQPIVRLADGMPFAAETLVRWNHPDRGLVAPAEFLPQAERDSALMAVIADVLGEQFMRIVSDLVYRHGRDWLPGGYSYNLAPIRLMDPMVVTRTVQILSDFGVSNVESLCEFELTEGAMVEVERGAPQVLEGLRNLGFRIALDDFGTGYSSLAQLPTLPLDTVKIDQGFVRALGQTETARAVVQAVSDIASAADLEVVAEGVELPLQRDILLSINPTILGQGWLYARSMPVREFEAWVTDRKLAIPD